MGEIRVSAQEGAKLFELAKGGDFQAFAKFLTWLERAETAAALSLQALYQPAKAAFRLGITGPPGAGKSTIVAILGDRIRYSEHALDQGVFIRSLGTRGSLGGLSSAAFLMARAFDACGFDILLIETVGVGQTELDVLHVADQVCVVLVPESGDSIQAMKAGLMEIADIFVVNKSDRPGAAGLAREIEASIHDGESAKAVQVLQCTASEGAGIPELLKAVLSVRAASPALANRTDPKRLREEAKALLRREWEHDAEPVLAKIKSSADLKKLFGKK
jgi:LAO/AO transport system kinase